jgi:hypothetical protein
VAKKSAKKKVGNQVAYVPAKTSKNVKIGTPVLYNPNGSDFGSRPKNKPVPAMVINDFTHEVDGEQVASHQEFVHPETQEKTTRQLFNLIVFQDTDAGVARKTSVPHKDDALEGESYFENY